MPRRARVFKREIQPDYIYNDQDIAKFINYITLEGKKSTAENIFYSAMNQIKENGHNPLDVFKTAISNIMPHVEVRSRRVGGSTYQVPVSVNDKRSKSLAFRWIVASIRKRTGSKTATKKLFEEIMDAYESKGFAVSKKEEMIKIAESNKAFSHYKW